MEFGITFKGFVEPNRARALVRQAENAGFTYCWFYDSHILWRESFARWPCAWSTPKPCGLAPA
jgi:alkanesulfonate monooxygenase SsuD/methylene tetrahydromethanopterin reductase-like flavin-dependent oxidoreductase (luciferase family)